MQPSQSDIGRGPALDDCIGELHVRVEEFKKAYTILSVRFPRQFQMKNLRQKQMTILFTEFLRTGKITMNPEEMPRV